MKVALITTPPSVRSGIGDYTRHLLPYLREHCDVQIFVEDGLDDPLWGKEKALLAQDLNPREFDQVLYQLGNEQSHHFMPRMIRTIGGTVMQHDWVLFDLAMKAYPSLLRGTAKGYMLALREGGVSQAGIYARNWADRRRQRTQPIPPVSSTGLIGTLLGGWYAPEDTGRWVSDNATLRLPSSTVRKVEIELHTGPTHLVRILHEGRTVSEGAAGLHSFDVPPSGKEEPLFVIETTGIRVSKEQRRHGDSRRLGSFVQRVSFEDESGRHDVDLAQSPAVPNIPVSLSRDRFRLSFNRSVVRFADAFIVHSNYVRDHILAERNSVTPIGVLHHGAEVRWRDEQRRDARRRLGLPEDWHDAFMVVSFGGVQRHKRIDKALQALAVARKKNPDLRLVLAGSLSADDFDPIGMSKSLGLEDAVHFTGFLPEGEAWDWLHAGNFSLNLRGPSSGGTSGGIFQSFSMGRPVIASDACEQMELPSSCTVKIPLEEGEIESLANTFLELSADPERCIKLEQGVRDFVDDECHWGIVGEQYAKYLESFPLARCSRKSVVAMQLALRRSAL